MHESDLCTTVTDSSSGPWCEVINVSGDLFLTYLVPEAGSVSQQHVALPTTGISCVFYKHDMSVHFV